MKLDTVALTALVAAGTLWFSAVFVAFVASFPFSLLIGIPLVLLSIVLIAVIRQRLSNKEDDYYAKNVDK